MNSLESNLLILELYFPCPEPDFNVRDKQYYN
jgi:hypothetical protein